MDNSAEMRDNRIQQSDCCKIPVLFQYHATNMRGGKKTTKGIKQMRDSLFGLPLCAYKPEFNSKVNVAVRKMSFDTAQTVASFDPKKAAKKLTRTSEKTWLKRGEKRTLVLFHAAAQRVPAYKEFLRKQRIKHGKIHTMNQFKKNVPPIDKDNYLRKYPLEKLCWDGELSSNQMISVSSGSSGVPFFWPRAQILDAETALEHELFLSSFFDLDTRSTLFVVCFAMGMYVAGPITMNSILHMSRKGYPVTVVTPGYSPDDVLNLIPHLAPKYDQVVLAGYPPYIKEIIDQGINKGINWKKINLRFLLAGEGFNESWRTYVAELAGGRSPIQDFLNLYGSADAAVLAYETQASIIIRRRIADDPKARERLFRDERLPSFLQFHPEHKYFENYGEELLVSAPGGIPLVRYNIHDRGGVLTRGDIESEFPELIEYFNDLKKEGKLWNLPFVYVFGKSDQTAILYGANVYPENIRRAIENEEIRDSFTGKIIMYTDVDESKDQRLLIDIECANSAQPSTFLAERTKQYILDTLLNVNSEYRVVNQGIGDRTIPVVNLFSYGDERFRTRKTKHQWTKKSPKTSINNVS